MSEAQVLIVKVVDQPAGKAGPVAPRPGIA